MQIGLRQFSADTVNWFKTLGPGTDRSRTDIARELCAREHWVDYRGVLSVSAACQRLDPLAQAAGVTLPPPGRPIPGDSHARPATDYPAPPVTGSLGSLGTVTLAQVAGRETGRRWEAMIQTHHPQGWRRAPGGQLKYWIVSSVHGVLGGLGFAAASGQLAPRDAFIGWSPGARMANIGRVICNQRFLILPSVKVRGLASWVLRQATARVADDWAATYRVRPLLVYTFTAREAGWSYRVARWRCAPQWTSGRRSGVRRAVWLKPLVRGWRETLQAAPRPALGWSKPWAGEGDWAAREYGRSRYPDGRLRRRLVAMGTAWQARPGEPLPVIFPGKAEQQGAYRFLSNRSMGMEDIVEPHFESTVQRCAMEPLVLAIQDTTTLNYSGLTKTIGLDALGGGGQGASGLLAHAGMAVNAVGRPLGLFDLQANFRQAAERDSARWRQGLARAGELARACPHTRVINVCDREGDDWALLRQARETGSALVVRVRKSARRQVVGAEGEAQDLWAYMDQAAPVGRRQIDVPACGGPNRRTGRTVRLTLRCEAVDLLAPTRRENDPPLRMIAVSAKEDRPSAAVVRKGTALHWLLLTTEGEPNRETAQTTLRWYELRWQIERFFHALKVGTRIEDRQLNAADDLRKCLAFDAITAFRVWDLTWLARTRPTVPAGDHVTPEEIEVLYAMVSRHGFKVPRGPPDIRTFVILTAGLAGFHPSKRQPMPGTQKLWEGHLRLSTGVFTYLAMRDYEPKH